MLLAAHIAVGAALGTATGNPVLAVGLSFISHYALDCVPHWDTDLSSKTRRSKTFLTIDIALGIIITIIAVKYLPDFINSNYNQELKDHSGDIANGLYNISNSSYTFMIHRSTILLCCIASVFPSILMIPQAFYKRKIKYLGWNTKLKNIFHFNDQKLMGKTVQVATIVVFGLYAFRQLPNSESPLFIQIILLMLFVVGIFALLEAFTDNSKNQSKNLLK